MNPPLKFALVGAHSCGKTSTLNSIDSGVPCCRAISELARKCPYDVNKKSTPFTQKWLLHNQIVAELDAEYDLHILPEQYGFILCDRSVFDPLIYWQANSFLYEQLHMSPKLHIANIEIRNYLRDTATRWARLHPYTHTFVFTQLINEHIHNDGFRDCDPYWQGLVDSEFQSFFSTPANVPYGTGRVTILPTDMTRTERINEVKNTILRYMTDDTT